MFAELFHRKNRNQCLCDTCKHEKATECIELTCKCCIQADKIRLNHPVVEESKEEQDEEKYREEQKEAEMYGQQIDVL